MVNMAHHRDHGRTFDKVGRIVLLLNNGVFGVFFHEFCLEAEFIDNRRDSVEIEPVIYGDHETQLHARGYNVRRFYVEDPRDLSHGHEFADLHDIGLFDFPLTRFASLLVSFPRRRALYIDLGKGALHRVFGGKNINLLFFLFLPAPPFLAAEFGPVFILGFLFWRGDGGTYGFLLVFHLLDHLFDHLFNLLVLVGIVHDRGRVGFPIRDRLGTSSWFILADNDNGLLEWRLLFYLKPFFFLFLVFFLFFLAFLLLFFLLFQLEYMTPDRLGLVIGFFTPAHFVSRGHFLFFYLLRLRCGGQFRLVFFFLFLGLCQCFLPDNGDFFFIQYPFPQHGNASGLILPGHGTSLYDTSFGRCHDRRRGRPKRTEYI